MHKASSSSICTPSRFILAAALVANGETCQLLYRPQKLTMHRTLIPAHTPKIHKLILPANFPLSEVTKSCSKTKFNTHNHHCLHLVICDAGIMQRPCNVYNSGMQKKHSHVKLQAWAARYNTGLLIKLTPKGVVFFFSFLFTSGFRLQTSGRISDKMRRRLFLVLQVLTWVLSYDGEQSPEPLAITAAGAALAVSGNLPLPSPLSTLQLSLPPHADVQVPNAWLHHAPKCMQTETDAATAAPTAPTEYQRLHVRWCLLVAADYLVVIGLLSIAQRLPATPAKTKALPHEGASAPLVAACRGLLMRAYIFRFCLWLLRLAISLSSTEVHWT